MPATNTKQPWKCFAKQNKERNTLHVNGGNQREKSILSIRVKRKSVDN